jgi:hypothetical protein
LPPRRFTSRLLTLGIDLPTILAESRKYALGLVVGTQTLGEFPVNMRDGCGSALLI